MRLIRGGFLAVPLLISLVVFPAVSVRCSSSLTPVALPSLFPHSIIPVYRVTTSTIITPVPSGLKPKLASSQKHNRRPLVGCFGLAHRLLMPPPRVGLDVGDVLSSRGVSGAEGRDIHTSAVVGAHALCFFSLSATVLRTYSS